VASASAVARFALLASILVGLLVVNAAPVAASDLSQADRVVGTALRQRGDPYRHYAKGPDRFDCVGLVIFAFNQNGLKDKIGGYRSPGGYYNWFRDRGLVTRDMSRARPGDLIIWGSNQHAGIYLGDGMAVSALINPYGVSKHRVYGYLGLKVKGFLRVNISR
jgi:cell wall-associated NlpC family hydrolase